VGCRVARAAEARPPARRRDGNIAAAAARADWWLERLPLVWQRGQGGEALLPRCVKERKVWGGMYALRKHAPLPVAAIHLCHAKHLLEGLVLSIYRDRAAGLP